MLDEQARRAIDSCPGHMRCIAPSPDRLSRRQTQPRVHAAVACDGAQIMDQATVVYGPFGKVKNYAIALDIKRHLN